MNRKKNNNNIIMEHQRDLPASVVNARSHCRRSATMNESKLGKNLQEGKQNKVGVWERDGKIGREGGGSGYSLLLLTMRSLCLPSLRRAVIQAVRQASRSIRLFIVGRA